jgi:malonyl-CoA/methylmalonyl-CoA synthetase
MPIQLITRAHEYRKRTAILDNEGNFTYDDLLEFSAKAASSLLDGKEDLHEARVAFLTPAGFQYVATQWGIWRAGGIAVPLYFQHPKAELEYFIEDSGASILVTHPDFANTLHAIAQTKNLRLIQTTELFANNQSSFPAIDKHRRAMILYTSGTTSKPKGVVTTHQNIEAQITSLVSAWGWGREDHILHTLPLHHVHGIINALTCALYVGAICEMLPKFDASEVWSRFIDSDLTLFMGVPTMYEKLIAYWESVSQEECKIMSEACKKFRLMISGSAALPTNTLEKWKKITGHILLERYGMTEIGMALSNSLHGRRVAGYVGTPLPNVEVRLVDDDGSLVDDGIAGEIEVRSQGVFLEYWNKPDATKEAFRDGWFRTGDIAVREDGIYRILGRKSMDIIKTGGYKVSALEIEEVLRTHPLIKECAVVGIHDEVWGERVCAGLVLNEKKLNIDELRQWAKEFLAPYKIPSRIILLDSLPRNALGKVLKPDLVKMFKDN